MLNSRSITKNYRELIISPKELIDLARFCYQPWKNEYEIAQKKWRSIKLPQIEKSIDKHNKDVKAKKSVYSFNTYLPIEESDKRAIIEKERDYFIHTIEQVYEFNSSFEIRLEGGTLTYRTPDDLKVAELEKAIEIEMEVRSVGSNKRILIDVSNGAADEHLSYTIEGKSEKWISCTKETIENFLDTCQKPHELTKKSFLLVIIPSIFLTFTIFKILEMVKLASGILLFLPFLSVYWLNLILVMVIFFPILIYFFREISFIFPSFAIRARYKPFETGFVRFAIFVIGSILSPVIFEIFRKIFLK